MLTKLSLTEKLRGQKTFLASEYGVKTIGLFGSILKDAHSEESDVDLVVDFIRPIGLRFVELADYLEQLLDAPVDLLTPDGIEGIRNPTIANSIRNSIEYV